MALVEPAGAPLTTAMVERLHIMADRYVRRHLEPKHRPGLAEAEHHAVLDAWLARDADTLRAEITTHLQRTLDDLRVELTDDKGTRR